ncbi:MAG: hypothetical protein LBR22_10105 [Desulfovibrio sp.]|jgi:hypothetical protein|nr:hypothetical protein [Desulfovibrio sp.]
MSFGMGKMVGKAKGKAEGITEGLAMGEIKALQNSVLRIAEVRFQSINASLNAKIRSINEPDALYDLLDATQKQVDAVAFERTVDATLHMAGAKRFGDWSASDVLDQDTTKALVGWYFSRGYVDSENVGKFFTNFLGRKHPLAVKLWKEMSHIVGKNIEFFEEYSAGHSEGYADGLQSSVLRIAELRFPPISASLNDTIRSINDPNVLNGLIDVALKHKGDSAAFERTVDTKLQFANAK